jgi:hypothetical protein
MAKTLKTYKLSDATLAQIAALAKSRNGNATAVIEIAVDRMYQQERNMRIDWYPDVEDTDALYGAHDYHILAQIDRDASVQQFVSVVERALQEAYPDAEVVVHRHGSNVPGTSATLAVDGLVDTVEAGRASAIVADVWANMDGWVVARRWRYDDTLTVDQLSATDLRQEAADIIARGNGPVQVATVQVEGETELLEVLYAPELGRAGIAWGADAGWTDCDSVQDAIERFLGDAMTD